MKENLMSALLKAQMNMSDAKKNSNNPHFKNNYADLNAVREAVIPVLNQVGVIVLQPMVVIDGFAYIKTQLVHAESGESIESFTAIISKDATNPQAVGSGISYARRYGLSSLMCIGAEDDDAQRATTSKIPLVPDSENWAKVVNAIKSDGYTIQDIKGKYRMSAENEKKLWALILGGYENE